MIFHGESTPQNFSVLILYPSSSFCVSFTDQHGGGSDDSDDEEGDLLWQRSQEGTDAANVAPDRQMEAASSTPASSASQMHSRVNQLSAERLEQSSSKPMPRLDSTPEELFLPEPQQDKDTTEKDVSADIDSKPPMVPHGRHAAGTAGQDGKRPGKRGIVSIPALPGTEVQPKRAPVRNHQPIVPAREASANGQTPSKRKDDSLVETATRKSKGRGTKQNYHLQQQEGGTAAAENALRKALEAAEDEAALAEKEAPASPSASEDEPNFEIAAPSAPADTPRAPTPKEGVNDDARMPHGRGKGMPLPGAPVPSGADPEDKLPLIPILAVAGQGASALDDTKDRLPAEVTNAATRLQIQPLSAAPAAASAASIGSDKPARQNAVAGKPTDGTAAAGRTGQQQANSAVAEQARPCPADEAAAAVDAAAAADEELRNEREANGGSESPVQYSRDLWAHDPW